MPGGEFPNMRSIRFLVLQLSSAVPWLTWDFWPTLDPRN